MQRKRGNVIDFKRLDGGGRQWLEELFKCHRGAVEGFLRARIGIDDSVDDLVQEVFSKVAGIAGAERRLPPDKSSTRAYLVSMANNLMVDKERQKSVRRRHLEKEALLPGEEDHRICELSPEIRALSGEQLDYIKQVILGMSPGTREVFLLNRFKGLTQKEIAARRGITLKQVEQYMRQAIQRLQIAADELKRW